MLGLHPKASRRHGTELLLRVGQLITEDVSVVDALRACRAARDEEGRLAAAILRSVSRGAAFHHVFGALVSGIKPGELRVLAAAEQSGSLENSIPLLASWMRGEQQHSAAAIRSLSYPFCLVATALGAAAFLGLSVLPTFAGLYATQGQPLPPLTQKLIGFGVWLEQDAGSVVSMVAGLTGAFLLTLKRFSTLRGWCWRAVDSCPGLGVFVEASAKARAGTFAALLLRSGCELADALGLVAAADSGLFGQRLTRVAAALQRGSLLSVAWRRHGLGRGGPDLVLLQLAEATGTYPRALAQIASLAAEHAEQTRRRSISCLQGGAMAFSATTVAVSAAALYEPILGSTTLVSGGLS